MVAAASVIIFCGIGIAAMLGAFHRSDAATPAVATTAPQDTTAGATPAPATEEKAKDESRSEKTVEHKPVRHETVRHEEREAAAPAAPVCNDCGTVVSVTPVTVQGKASGVGAVGGAILGGVLGHQFGGGHGKDAMTAVGAIGGALAGNQIEKSQRQSTRYDVTVRLENGETRTFSYASDPAVSVGTRVRVQGDNLIRD
jgi:outer membrane lipoprotein SlyB